MLNEEQTAKLAKPLPKSAIKKRKASWGKDVSYIEGFYAIDKANEIFGYGKWSTTIRDLRMVWEGSFDVRKDKEVKKRYAVHYICIGDVWFEEALRYEDVGYGNGTTDTDDFGIAHELAAKEAVTDCMKRCLRHFGNQFGNSLYDKDNSNNRQTDAKPSPRTEQDLTFPPQPHSPTPAQGKLLERIKTAAGNQADVLQGKKMGDKELAATVWDVLGGRWPDGEQDVNNCVLKLDQYIMAEQKNGG